MKYVTVIPARGGSKRFPGKNIFPLGGKPLLAHSILYSQQVLPDTEVYVSTDNEEIANVAREYGAGVIERPEELSGDLCSTDLAMQHAATQLLQKGKVFDYTILLQATNPLRPDGMMEEAIQTIETGKYDSLFTVTPLVRKLGRLIDGKFVPWNFKFGQRSQDMEPLYFENGLLYITHRNLILKGQIRGNSLFSLIVDHLYGDIDIDKKDDLLFAEFFNNRYETNEEV